jgi:NADH-quinone oxidoreductase subunit N
MIQPPVLNFAPVVPMLIVAGGALLLPMAEVFLARMVRNRGTWLRRPMTRELAGTMMAFLAAGTLGLALLFTLGTIGEPAGVFNADRPTIVIDGLARFLNAVILMGSLMTVLVSVNYLAELRMARGEYYGLLLAAVLGMMLLTAVNDLLMLFLALELMSIPIYALAGFERTSLRANESALKYFIIGSFAAAILLYGCALLYGVTGTIQIDLIAKAFDPESSIALLGAAFVLIGLAFKIASVPFHQWAPDVYEGAPTTVSGFMATTVKVAGFGALLRVLAHALPGSSSETGETLYWVLWWMAVLSMTVGNVMAIVQQNVKRLLAYSSIAHAGYLLVGVAVGTEKGYAAVLFYLLVYTFMTLGAFAVLAILARNGDERSRVEDLAGLHSSRPFFAAVMAICMFSLAGIPLFGGFIGKFQLFSAAIAHSRADQSLLWLAILGVLNSAVSLAYYLRIPVVMYMREPATESPSERGSGFFGFLVLATCATVIILLGTVPEGPLFFWQVDALAFARTAAATLIP